MLPIDLPLIKARLRPTVCGPYGAPDIEEHIANLVDDMCEADGKQQLELARMVVAYDRENIDAHLVLAEHAGSLAEEIALLREAVRIGKHLWAAALEDDSRTDWWHSIGTRPFMRAVMAYGEVLVDADRPDDAAKCFQILLDMDPDDHLDAASALSKIEGEGPARRR